MRTLRFVVVGLFFLSLAAVPAVAGGDEKLMKEVEALGDALTKALLAEDVEGMLTMYAEDAISLPNNSPRMDGKDAFRRQHEQMAATGMKILSFENQPSDVWEVGGQVVEIGTYDIALSVPGMSETMKEKGKYMTVYIRDSSGTLKVKAETWNTDIDPMEMMAQKQP